MHPPVVIYLVSVTVGVVTMVIISSFTVTSRRCDSCMNHLSVNFVVAWSVLQWSDSIGPVDYLDDII